MNFRDSLISNVSEIAKVWLDRTLKTYPKDSFAFLKDQKDRFANPVGNTHRAGITKLVELVSKLDGKTDYRSALIDIIKIRSVQNFSHAEAVAFVVFLKDVVRSVLKKEIKDQKTMGGDLMKFDLEVDRMLLHAFDVYSDLREQLFKIRIGEVKRNVASLIRRTGFVDEDMEN